MNSVSNRVKLLLGITALLLLAVFWILYFATAAQGSFQLEYAEGVARPDGIVAFRTVDVQPTIDALAQGRKIAAERAEAKRRAALVAAAASGPRMSSNTAAVPTGSVASRVAAAWPGDDRWALATVGCESGFNPQAVGGGGDDYFGLWQFGPWARSVYGNPLGMSVEGQTMAAWRLLKDEGSGQWSCSPWSYHP